MAPSDLTEERQRAEANERQKQVAEVACKRAEQEMADRQRSYEENIRQLQQKMEEDTQNLREEQEKVLTSRMLEQEKLLKEGFAEKARGMEQDIERLRKEQAEAEEKAAKTSTWDSIVSVLSPIGALFSLAKPITDLFSSKK